VPTALSNVIAISAGMEHNEALQTNGFVYVWGNASNPGYADVPFQTNAVAISAGWHYGSALLTDTTVQNWGQGDTDITIDSVVALSAEPTMCWLSAPTTMRPLFGGDLETFLRLRGANTNIFVVASSTTNLFFQWQRSITNVWSNLAGKTNPVLPFTGLQDSDDGTYRVIVSNSLRLIASRPVLVETLHAPIIALQSPELNMRRLLFAVSENLSVLVTNTGARFLQYDWIKDGATAPMAMGSSAMLSYYSTNTAGDYHVVIHNPAGSVTSAVWHVSISLSGGATMWGSTSFGERNGLSQRETNWVAIAVGSFHTLGLRENGTVVAWGNNTTGGQTNVPAGLTNVVAIAAGDFHNLALLENGTVRAWGGSASGQTNVPSGLTNVTSIAAAGAQSLALRSDGTLAAWGFTAVPAGVSNVAAISAGTYHALGLRSNGTVQVWQHTDYEYFDPPAGLTNVVATASGTFHALALKEGGTITGWGRNWYGETNPPAGLSNVWKIAAGLDFSMALKNDGTVTAWGRSDSGQTNVQTGFFDTYAIAAGSYHSVALAYNAALEYPAC
jgi:alpha-tubulin suppressor-like RCC1 family protein